MTVVTLVTVVTVMTVVTVVAVVIVVTVVTVATNCDKSQVVTKPKNSIGDKTKKLKLLQNSITQIMKKKTQVVTKLKL